MTDTLPIIFAAGQNEGIDPRVLPPEQHKTVKNVRFRKDGRPQKRPGIFQIASTGLDSGGTLYSTQYTNAIAEWQGSPVLALGSGVRQYASGSWSPAADAKAGELSHWGPGERLPVARDETVTLARASIGACNGVVVIAWDDGTDCYVSVRTTSGAVIRAKMLLQTFSTSPRVVSTTNYIYVVFAAAGGVYVSTFDPSTLTFDPTVRVLQATVVGSFDAVGRGSEFLLATQITSSVILVQRISAVAVPVSLASNNTNTFVAGSVAMAVAGTATSSVFVAWLEPSTGRVAYATGSNNLAGLSGAVSVNLSVNNIDAPGIAMNGNTAAVVYFGGSILGAYQNFVSARPVDNTGTLGTLVTYPFVRMVSKPFNGPAEAVLGAQDRGYFWAHTNENGSGTPSFDDQRTHYLLQGPPYQSTVPRRQMWTPNLPGQDGTGGFVRHLYDVVDTADGNGFITVLQNATRLQLSVGVLPESVGFDTVSIHSIFGSKQEAARDAVTTGRVLQFSGGTVAEFNADSEETGFSNPPSIQTVTLSAGTTLAASSTYIYRAVVEYIDKQGRRQRSAPSDPISVTTPASVQDADLTIWGLVAYTKANRPVVHVYRTLANQSTFHRASQGVSAPSAYGGIITYNDRITDTNLASREIIYTDGGVLDNTAPPPCTFMTFCAGRLWLGGQLDRNVLTASKLLVDGEPTQFSDSDQFNVFLPEKCTGLASIDGTIVAFSRNSIYLVTGEGPDDQGNGFFNPPVTLPTDVGCIEWRSVVETSIGIFFQSKRGIFLLPRGFNTPVFVGAPVQDTLATYPVITSATLLAPADGNEITVRFTATNAANSVSSVVLIYDLRTGGWSVDSSPDGTALLGIGGSWLDVWAQEKMTSGGAFNSIWQENAFAFDDNTVFIPSTLATGDIRPFGLAGYGNFNSVMVVGEYRGSALLKVTVSVDGVSGDVFSFPVTAGDGADGVVYLDVTPRIRKGSSIAVTCADAANPATGSAPTAGFIVQGVFIEHEMIGKTKPLALARRL